jgi:hypothetical protein
MDEVIIAQAGLHWGRPISRRAKRKEGREIIAPSVLGAGEPPAVPVKSLNDLSASATNVAEVLVGR